MSDQPERFTLDRIATPIGTLLIAVDSEMRLRVLDFSDYEDRMRRLLRRGYGAGGVQLNESRAPASIRLPIDAYFAGDLAALDAIPVETAGTAFQREVWTALRDIPAGSTLSYSGLAEQIGRPSAVRAVGLANGANPIGVVVPCHRVIGADASLTGYGGGIERKRWLLAHEGVDVAATGSRRRAQLELALAP
jgi:methylated-DNA-[protein]-cysteine S-methyltransferase